MTQPCTAPLNQEVAGVERYWPLCVLCWTGGLSRDGSTATILIEKKRMASAESFVPSLKVQLFLPRDANANDTKNVFASL